MTDERTTPARVANEDYVQARVAEMEGKLERAVRDFVAQSTVDAERRTAETEKRLEEWRRESAARSEEWRRESASRLEEWRRETQQRIDAMHADNQRLLRWMIGIGVVLTLAVLIRPSIG